MRMRSTAACVVMIGAALMLPSVAAAAMPPTAVSVLTGRYGDGKLAGLVATQRVGARRVKVSGYLADHPLADDVAFSVVLRSGRCSSSGARRKALLSAKVISRDGSFLGVAAVKPAVLRRGASWYLVEKGEPKPLACARVGRFAPQGLALAAREAGSRLATGKRQRGLVILRRTARRVRVTQLLSLAGGSGDTGTHEIGASGHTCAEPFTATDDLWQWRKIIDDEFMDYTEEAWDFAATKSIAVVRTDAPAGAPILCAGIMST
jgi:hypothetical protein